MQDHPPTSAGAGALSASVPQLARLLKSADKAVMLVHIHDLLTSKGYKFETVKLDERDIANGRWVRYPIADWHEQHFTWLGKNTVNTLLNSLRDDDGLLLATSQRLLETQPKYDRTLWYTLDYDALGKLLSIEPENLKTKRNKRLAPDDPNRTPPFSFEIVPPTNAPVEQDAPQTTPSPRMPAEPAQDVTAAHVEREAPAPQEAPAPPRTPRVKLPKYIPKEVKDGYLYWESASGDTFVCEVEKYMQAVVERLGRIPYPRQLPNIAAEKEGHLITLHVPNFPNDLEWLETLTATHFDWKKQGKGWERR